MTYELAKQLKDAGFPQKCNEGDRFWGTDYDTKYVVRVCGVVSYSDDGGADTYEIGEGIKIPSLSELIEACKTDDGFVLMGPNTNIPDTDEATPYGLIKHKGGILPQWRAFIRNAADSVCADGSNPEEAVAKLWLILNQK